MYVHYGRLHSPCSPCKSAHFEHECVEVCLYALQGLNKHINIISGHHKWNISDYYFYYVFIVCILYYLYFGKSIFYTLLQFLCWNNFPNIKLIFIFNNINNVWFHLTFMPSIAIRMCVPDMRIYVYSCIYVFTAFICPFT